MKREAFLELLEAYRPSSEEIVFKQRMIDFVKKNADCFERTLTIGHITASCWLVNFDNSKALLTHHAKLNKWFQLGGHCDGDSDVVAVALKEAHEESGLRQIVLKEKGIFDIDIHRIPDTSKEPAHDHYDVRFLLQAVSDEPFLVSHESKSLAWFDRNLSELPTNNPSVTRLFTKWLER
jgi:8-oxo-dGTP pyrophosphatase MutT (NUDIX family)